MKRVVLTAFVGIICLSAAQLAAAADHGWSVEMGVGQSMYKNSDIQLQIPPPTSNSSWDASYDTRPQATRLMVAYNFNRYWGVEAGQVKLGRAAGAAAAIFIHNRIDVGGADYNSARVDAKGWQLSGFADYPFADHWMVYGRAGFIDAKVHYQLQTTPGFNYPIIQLTDIYVNSYKTSVKGTYGVGIGMMVNPEFTLKLGWDKYQNLGSSDTTGTYGINLVTLGVQISFR